MSIKTKYAPKSLNDVVYPDSATELRVKSLSNGTLKGHVIFHGPRGTAKTTTANLLAQTLSGSSGLIDTDFVGLLKNSDLTPYLERSCQITSFNSGSKVILLFNEFDNYKETPYQLWDAMDALQSKGLMLIITTNELMAIHPSLRSRCRLIEFPAVSAIAMLPRAQQILSAEGLNLPNEQVLSYLMSVERFGDHRKYIDLLEELLLLHSSGHPMPAWSGQMPTFSVVT